MALAKLERGQLAPQRVLSFPLEASAEDCSR
jgi:hypothetical protein